MARVTVFPGGRSSKFTYGTQSRYDFSIKFPTVQMNAPGGLNTMAPTSGTLIIAGTTVTLGAGDIVNPAAVAAKIKATSISGWNVEYAPVIAPFTIILVSTTVGAVAAPTIALGTATNILFYDFKYYQGVPITIGAQDDIEILGSPATFVVTYTGGTVPDLQFSDGADWEQEQGTLSYGTAVTLATVNGISNAYSLTTPAHWARLTTKASNTQAILYISR